MATLIWPKRCKTYKTQRGSPSTAEVCTSYFEFIWSMQFAFVHQLSSHLFHFIFLLLLSFCTFLSSSLSILLIFAICLLWSVLFIPFSCTPHAHGWSVIGLLLPPSFTSYVSLVSLLPFFTLSCCPVLFPISIHFRLHFFFFFWCVVQTHPGMDGSILWKRCVREHVGVCYSAFKSPPLQPVSLASSLLEPRLAFSCSSFLHRPSSRPRSRATVLNTEAQ